MRRILLSCCAAVALLTAAGQASANTVTFDGVSVPLGGFFEQIDEDGLRVTNETSLGDPFNEVFVVPAQGNPNNSAVVDGASFSDLLTVQAINGMDIDLQSLDLVCLEVENEASCSSEPAMNIVEIEGPGGTPRRSLEVSQAYQTFDFGAEWEGLESVSFGAQGAQVFLVDNITAQVVPLPAAGWAMIAGLGALAGMRTRARRRH